jgi:gliding motility-associated-like protein
MGLKYYLLLFLLFFWNRSHAQPINDEPCDAIELLTDTICNFTLFTNVGSSTSMGVGSPPCGNYQNNDVWFKIVVPLNGHLIIDSQMNSFTDGGMAAYTGTCSSLSIVNCDDDGSYYNAMPKLTLENLTPGSILYIRFWKYNGGSGTFSLCAIAPNNSDLEPECSGNPPAGNDCLMATPICDLNGYCGTTSSIYTANFWPELQNSFCSLIENNSFISFVAAETSVTFKIWITDVVYSGGGIQLFVFSADGCSGPVTPYFCWNPGYANNTPEMLTIPGLIVGETYYIMIDGYGGAVCDYTIASFNGIALPVTISPSDTTVCFGDSITLTASGGNGIYTWNSNTQLNSSSGESILIPPPSSIGSYFVSVNSPSLNNICNSSSSDISIINVVSCPSCTITANSSGPTCVGGSINLFSSNVPAGNYEWNGPNGFYSTDQNPSNVIVPIYPGTYTYTVNIEMGQIICSSQTNVVVYPQPIVNPLNYSFVCSNASPFELIGNPIGGVFTGFGVQNNYFYPSVGSQTILYEYVDTNGCSNYSTVFIDVHNSPTVSAGEYLVQCVNNNLLPLGGTPTGGVFSGSGVINNFFDPSYGTQIIEYIWEDSLGCLSSDTSLISVFIPDIINGGNYQLQCPDNDFLELIGVPAGGVFSGIGVFGDFFDPAYGSQTIEYYFDQILGCEGSSEVFIHVSNITSLETGEYSPVCLNGDPISLNGFPFGGEFSGIGVSSNSFDPIYGTQTIYYTYEDTLGCSFMDSTEIFVYDLPTVYAGEDLQICLGTEIMLSGSGGSYYQWNDNVIDSQWFIPYIGFHPYILNGFSADNCSNSDTVLVTVLDEPISNFTLSNNIYYPDEQILIENISMNSNLFYWNFGNGQILESDDLNVSTSYATPGVYTIQLIASNGVCSDTLYYQITISPFPPPNITVPNVFTPNGDNNNDFLIVDSKFIKEFKMIIFNRWGNEIFQFNNTIDKWDGKQNGQVLNDGVYFYTYQLVGQNGVFLKGEGFITLLK